MTLSKRDDSVASSENPIAVPPSAKQSLTIKPSQITKSKDVEALYDKVDLQRKVLNDIKRILGDSHMTDQSIVDRIVILQEAQRSLKQEKRNTQEEHLRVVSQLVNRHQMQVEDLNGQLLRMQ